MISTDMLPMSRFMHKTSTNDILGIDHIEERHLANIIMYYVRTSRSAEGLDKLNSVKLACLMLKFIESLDIEPEDIVKSIDEFKKLAHEKMMNSEESEMNQYF